MFSYLRTFVPLVKLSLPTDMKKPNSNFQVHHQ